MVTVGKYTTADKRTHTQVFEMLAVSHDNIALTRYIKLDIGIADTFLAEIDNDVNTVAVGV